MKILNKYKEVKISKNILGYPKLCFVNNDIIIFTTWIGKIFTFNLNSMTIKNHIFVGTPNYTYGLVLDLPCINPVNFNTCICSNRTNYAILWDIRKNDFQKIASHKSGSINCVSYSTCGNYILFGKGMYSLKPEYQKGGINEAHLELWSIKEDKPKFLKSTILPGVCVDSIIWDSDNSEIICLTGMISQDQGFVIRLNSYNLEPISYIEIPVALNYKCICIHNNAERHIIVLNQNDLYEFIIEGKENNWDIKFNENVFDMDYNPNKNELILSNGNIYDCDEGQLIKRLEPLPDCTSIIYYPNGGYIGISESGVIRYWE
jgi:hypothetical protein